MLSASNLLKDFKNLKTIPHVAIRLSQMTSDPNITAMEIEGIIRLDTALVVRLLRLINSAYYGLHQKIDSIAMAVVYLGMDNLRNMVIIEALKEIFRQGQQNDFFSRNQLWFHCVVVSICNQMISERIFRQKGEDAFLCGILHDIGMIIEYQLIPDLFVQACKNHKSNTIPLTEYEKQIIGTDHSEVGSLLASEWKIPSEVQKGIKYHHKSMDNISPFSILGIIQISEYISCNQTYVAIPGMTVNLSPPLRIHIHENIAKYKTLIRDLPGEIAKAKEIYHLS